LSDKHVLERENGPTGRRRPTEKQWRWSLESKVQRLNYSGGPSLGFKHTHTHTRADVSDHVVRRTPACSPVKRVCGRTVEQRQTAC